VQFGQRVHVGVRVTRLGNKSLTMEYSLVDMDTRQEMASGSTALVAYDYHTAKSIPIPDVWRRVISDFEQLSVIA
jgi:acyl-CoA thioester hydrolase